MIRIPRYPARLDKAGRLRVKFLGVVYNLPKPIGSKESLARYAELVRQFTSGQPPRIAEPDALAVSQLVAECLAADPRGLQHPRVIHTARACVPLERLFGQTPANEFSTVRLKAVQESMISRSWQTDDERKKLPPWGLTYINQQINLIRGVFRWGEESGLLREGIWHHLCSLRLVPANRPGVKPAKKRCAADWDKQVQPVLPFVSPTVAALMQVQFLVGCRPSEVLDMRRCELDRDAVEGVWLFRPAKQKVAAVKVIGPRAQAIIAPWLLLCPEPGGYVFRSQNGVDKPYRSDSYRLAIARACRRAGVPHFFPYQIRHSAGKHAEEQAVLATASALLGHRNLETTKGYTEQQRLKLAVEFARRVG